MTDDIHLLLDYISIVQWDKANMFNNMMTQLTTLLHICIVRWGRKCQPIPVFLPGELHGQRSLADYSPWGRKRLDITEVT